MKLLKLPSGLWINLDLFVAFTGCKIYFVGEETELNHNDIEAFRKYLEEGLDPSITSWNRDFMDSALLEPRNPRHPDTSDSPSEP